jgi:hypothetical protein
MAGRQISRVRVLAVTIALLSPLALAGCSHEGGVGRSPGELPPVFAGGMIDTETLPPWSIDIGHFSGYQTKFTFTKLVFAPPPGPGGLYTLREGFVGAESGSVIEQETAPGFNPGNCSATFTFASAGGTVPDAKLSGNIGGMSRTSTGYHVTIELGVILPGVITGSSNCGPNNMFTSHPFGEPPKISIPVTATGEFNSATGVLTVDSTNTATVAGGAQQTDDVTGTMYDTTDTATP